MMRKLLVSSLLVGGLVLVLFGEYLFKLAAMFASFALVALTVFTAARILAH